MASYARRMIEAGARIVGGCCGTTPEHIKKIRDYVASVVPRHQPAVVSRETVTAPAGVRSEEHTSELQSQSNLVCRLLLEKKKIFLPANTIVTTADRALVSVIAAQADMARRY